MTILQQLSGQLSLSPDFEARFLAAVEPIHLPKNGFLVRQGETCRYLALLQEGYLYSSIETESGAILVDDLFLPESFVTSYRSFLTQCPSPGSIQAYSPASLYAISYQTYLTLQESPDWLKFFKHLSELLFIRKCQKTTALITQTAAQRYEALVSPTPALEQHFPQFLIASYLKVRPETLSRLKSLDLHQGKDHRVGPTFEP